MEFETIIVICVFALITTMEIILIYPYMKYIKFGYKAKRARKKYHNNFGWLWKTSTNNDLSLPVPIKLDDFYNEDINENQGFMWNSKQVKGMTFLGRPFVMFNPDDTKTTVGFYYQQTLSEKDNMGNGAYYSGKDGKYLRDGFGNRIPILSTLKPSITLNPKYPVGLIAQESILNMRNALYDFIKKNKYLLYFVIGLLGGVGVSVYISFQVNDYLVKEIPVIKQLLAQILEALQ